MTAITNYIRDMLNKETPFFKRIGFGTILQTAVAMLNNRVSIGIAAGANAGVVNTSAFSPEMTSIVAVFAITTATGAAAAKLLLALTTDYTFANGVLTTVGDKSAVTLVVVYK
jgi:hypothetical protein